MAPAAERCFQRGSTTPPEPLLREPCWTEADADQDPASYPQRVAVPAERIVVGDGTSHTDDIDQLARRSNARLDGELGSVV